MAVLNLNSLYGSSLKEIRKNTDSGKDRREARRASGANTLIATKAVAAAEGAMTLATGAMDLAKNNDAYSDQFEGLANNIMNELWKNTSTDDLLAQWSSRDTLGSASWDLIRGGTKASRGMAVGNSILSGATTGLSVGGPWGALVGTVVGAGAGIGGLIAGNKKASREEERLNALAQVANLYQTDSMKNNAWNILLNNIDLANANWIGANGGYLPKGRYMTFDIDEGKEYDLTNEQLDYLDRAGVLFELV